MIPEIEAFCERLTLGTFTVIVTMAIVAAAIVVGMIRAAAAFVRDTICHFIKTTKIKDETR